MSGSRLPLLCPLLFRSPLTTEAPLLLRTARARRPGPPLRTVHASARRLYQTQVERYGTANEPIPLPQPGESQQQQQPVHRKAEIVGREGDEELAEDDRGGGPGEELSEGYRGTDEAARDAAEGHPAERVTSTALQISQRPLEKVLHMEPPTSSRQDRSDHHHLQPPPYVHHFDTFSLVRKLEDGGFTSQQSITVMKAVRGLLAENMQVARDELVSKSDVENESYLFRAACSELRTEVQNGRKATADKMRSERAHLQHEVDILSQKVSQETLNVKDELKGMFDDRKMAVRHEQRSMESSIQELNYEIQTQLNGESKGDIEGLRWHLTKRAAFFIATFAIMILGSIRYSVHMTHVQQQEREKLRQVNETKPAPYSGGGNGSRTGSNGDGLSGESTEAVLSGINSGPGQSYVSLG